MTGRSQCVITTGVSGSGKSLQLRNICHYICEVAGWTKMLTRRFFQNIFNFEV